MGYRDMTATKYTPEDFDKMIGDLNVPLNTYYFTNEEKARLRFALAFTQKMLGEPSEEEISEGVDAYWKSGMYPASTRHERASRMDNARKAMIEQAVKEIEDGK